MSALITSSLVTPCGGITNQTLGGYVDAAGNVVGSPGFLPNYVIDYAGNLGTLPAITDRCSFIASIIGSAFEPGPWEAQQNNVEVVGSNMSTNATAYVSTVALPLTNFASANTTGIMSGVVSGAGPWTIQGSGVIGGVSLIGGGTIITSANNTLTGTTTVQTGAILQAGLDTSATTGSINTAVVEGNATLNLYGANTTQFAKVGALTVNTAGVVNFEGPDICGQGNFKNGGAVTNNGTINIDNSIWQLTTSMAGTGVINVKDGGTFANGNLVVSASQTVNLNGCGWCDASSVKQGALRFDAVGTSWNAVTNIKADSCIMSAPGTTTTFGGLLKGGAALTVGTLSGTKPNGIVTFGNASNSYYGTMTVDATTIKSSGTSLQYAHIVLANSGVLTPAGAGDTIGSIASADSTTVWNATSGTNNYIKANGVTTMAGRIIGDGNVYLDGAGNQLTLTSLNNSANIYVRTGSKLVMQGASLVGTATGQIRVQTGGVVSAGTSTTASAYLAYIDGASSLEVKAVGAGTGILNIGAGTSVLTAGWKVDLPDVLAPGVYPILKNTGPALTQLPVTGINATGRTVSYAWNNAVTPKVLNMTVV